MADSRLVKDVMFPAVQLKIDATVGEALRTLRKNVPFGVVSDEEGEPFAIVTREHLRAAKVSELVQVLPTSMPHSRPTEPYSTLDSIVQTYADDFVVNPDLRGIVVQEQGEVQGVLLRETVEEHLLDMLNAGRLPGTPGLLFRCKQCDCSGVRESPPQCPRDSKRKMERSSS